MAHPKMTLYDLLAVPLDASSAEIAAAYERVKAALAGAGNADPNAHVVLRHAYDVLKDPKRRAAYDASLATAQQKSAAPVDETVVEIEPPTRKVPWIPIAIAAGVVLAIILVALRPSRSPPPAPEPQPVAEPTPAPAPAPKAKSGVEIMADASASGGPLLSYSMSGQATLIGIALSTEQGMMVTTCHGIPGGGKLVVRVGSETFPADVLITDESVDLCKLQIAGFGAPPVKISADAPKAGDRIYAVGVNAKGEPAVTEGTVKQLLETVEGRLIELSMPIGEYSSGGGVFDAYGRLVGIATVQHKSGLSIALPASNIALMRSRGATK